MSVSDRDKVRNSLGGNTSAAGKGPRSETSFLLVSPARHEPLVARYGLKLPGGNFLVAIGLKMVKFARHIDDCQ